MQKFYLNIESEPQEGVLLKRGYTVLERSSLNRVTDGSPGPSLSAQSVIFPKMAFLKTGIPGIWTGPKDGQDM